MRSLAPFVAAALLAGSAHATVTTASKTIGGAGGYTSCGLFDPPTICDGTTLASATVDFTYDDGVSPPRLTLVVTNTSPVVTGVGNPLMTSLYFNTPAGALAGLTLVSQTGTAGPAPNWSLNFDADLTSNPNPNGADGMGAYNAALTNPGGSSNSIGNVAADTFCIPTGNVVIGPVTFEFDVALVPGGATLTAGAFASAFSNIPPGQRQANVCAHFQAGGPNCDSGFITNNPGCSPGAFVTGTVNPGEVGLGTTVTFTMSGAPGCDGCLGMSTSPGPTILPQPPFPAVVIPLGAPIWIIIPSFFLPPNATLSVNVFVPNDPALLLAPPFHFAVLQMDVNTGEMFVSAGFTLTIVP